MFDQTLKPQLPMNLPKHRHAYMIWYQNAPSLSERSKVPEMGQELGSARRELLDCKVLVRYLSCKAHRPTNQTTAAHEYVPGFAALNCGLKQFSHFPAAIA